ncbi:MAG: TPM domain-containing protein [Coprobacter sp.]|nr:TPM domain-containing protein [Coprobacter sp.]
MKHTLAIILLCFLVVSSAFSARYTVETVPNVQKSDIRRFVSNPDNILNASTEHYLNTRIDSMRRRTSAEAAVVVVESIGEQDIESFAVELFAKWGIGKKENNNGLLVLFVLDQRKIRFETGYGLEGVLPDALCKRIQSQRMLPAFRNGNYDEGFITGIDAVCNIIEQPENRSEVFVAKEQTDDNLWSLLKMYLGISLLFTFVMLLMVRPDKNIKNPVLQYRAYETQLPTLRVMAILFPLFNLITLLWILAYMRGLRNKKRKCDNCGHTMHKLNEEEDNKFLNERENAEEIINSVDYDVWLCDQCGTTEVFAYPNKHSRYAECPVCHARTFALESDKVVYPPTHLSEGRGEKDYHCRHCHYRDVVPYTIPILITPIIIGGGRRGGGFGGGSIGGGFGGGISGGGGSTSGW